MSKKFPDLRSDEEADAWLQSADLSEYDLSGMKKVRFELARKDASISLRLPAALLATLKANAARANMPTQRLIRMMIEAQLAETGAGPKRKVVAPRRTRKHAAYSALFAGGRMRQQASDACSRRLPPPLMCFWRRTKHFTKEGLESLLETSK